VAAGVALPGEVAFAGDDGDHGEACGGVGPPPAEEGVEAEAGEEDGGEPGAELGLFGIGDHGGAGEGVADAAFGAGEPGHDEEGGDGEGDADPGFGGAFAGEKAFGGFVEDVGGEGVETDGDELLGAAFGFGVGGAEAPEHDGGGGGFDDAIDAEADEGDGAGHDAGGERDDGFEDVVGEGGVFEKEAFAEIGGVQGLRRSLAR
jgi:hypothetical protein